MYLDRVSPGLDSRPQKPGRSLGMRLSATSLICHENHSYANMNGASMLLNWVNLSLVPRPERGRRKRPGFHCLHMRLITGNRNTRSKGVGCK